MCVCYHVLGGEVHHDCVCGEGAKLEHDSGNVGVPAAGAADGSVTLSVKLNRAFRVRRLRTTHTHHYTELLTLRPQVCVCARALT